MSRIHLIRWFKRIKQTSTTFLAAHCSRAESLFAALWFAPLEFVWVQRGWNDSFFLFWWCVSVKDISVTFPFKGSSRRGEKLPIRPLSVLKPLLWWWKSGLRARKEHTSARLHANHRHRCIPHTQMYRIVRRNWDTTNKETEQRQSTSQVIAQLCEESLLKTQAQNVTNSAAHRHAGQPREVMLVKLVKKRGGDTTTTSSKNTTYDSWQEGWLVVQQMTLLILIIKVMLYLNLEMSLYFCYTVCA